jgi:hypothetical protein
MDRSLHQPTEPSLSATFGRTLDLAQRVATDELRLVQLELKDLVSGALRGGVWLAGGAFCLAIAWIVVSAAAVVALEGRLPLEARLVLLAIAQLALGASLVGFGLRRRKEAP